MTSFLLRMGAGIPGALTRQGKAKVEPVNVWPQGTTGAFPAYGVAGVWDASTGQFRVVKSTDTVVRGFLVRPYPTSQALAATQGLAQGTPQDGVNDSLISGWMSVKLRGATAAAKGGLVYVRIANADSTHVIGGVEAAPETSAASAAKSGGNTGNGTFVLDATTPVQVNARAGIYTLRCTVAGTNSGTFRLVDPLGRVLGDYAFSGSGGTVTVNDQIKGVITDGATDFVVGDGFDVTVTFNTIQLPDTSWFEGPADASGNVEIAFNV